MSSHTDDLCFTDRDIEITLYKQPHSKNFYARFQWQKKQKRVSCLTPEIGEAKNHCYKILEILRSDKDKGIVRLTPINDAKMTFKELFNSFVRYKDINNIVSKRTIQDYHTRGKNLINFCGDWIVEEAFRKYDKSIYGSYIKYRNDNRQKYQINKTSGEKKGKKLPENLSGKTINGECVLLHTILSYAKYDLNMLYEWNIPKFSHHKIPENNEITCPDRKEYKLMKTYWMYKIDEEGRKDHYRPILNLYMRLCSNIGARPAEMRNFKLTDVDFKQNILWIRNRKQKKTALKNELITSFPITDRIQPFLEEIIKITAIAREDLKVSKHKSSKNKTDSQDSDYLFLDPDTKKRLGDFKKSWTTMLERLKLSKKYTPKTLRKIFITKMVKQSSVPLSVIANLVGHTNTYTLQKYYIHLRVEDNRRALTYAYSEINEKNRKQKVRIDSKIFTNRLTKKDVLQIT
jgi:hypothetical protein